MLGGSKTRKTALVPCTVVSAKTMHTWLLLGKISEDLSGETVEKATKSRSSKTNSHVVPLGCYLIHDFFSYIYEYISTYRPTFSVNYTRESKNQIGMALLRPDSCSRYRGFGLPDDG